MGINAYVHELREWNDIKKSKVKKKKGSDQREKVEVRGEII